MRKEFFEIKNNMGMAYAAGAARQAAEQKAAAPQGEEFANKISKDGELSLGDLNPLIHPVDLTRRESVNAVSHVILKNIRENNGALPTSLESAVVYEPKSDKSAFRFVARFEVSDLTDEKIQLLEEVVGERYGSAVRTRKDAKGNEVDLESYPPTTMGVEWKASRKGWYMGPNLSPTTSHHAGLYVFRDLGTIDKSNFVTNEQASAKHIVEIREAGMYQTDLVAFATQVSSILGEGKKLPEGEMIYKSYYDLMRLSLKKVGKESLYGLEDQMDAIYRGLITPIASPDLSRGIKQEPESVLEVGIPGTGKTLTVEALLQEDNDIFILPIDPIELQKELMLPKEKQTLLARFAEVSKVTGKRVVLHVDDIENMVGSDNATHSTMLNLMAGVRESGFNIIAATNYPEKIDPALLQPQRFGVLIHFPLQDERARTEILKIHANEESRQLGLPLFDQEGIRDVILGEVAKQTKGFTPRYLGEVVTVAKSNLVSRIVADKNRRVGLQEADLEGHTFTVEDWEQALAEVVSRYDKKGMEERDEQLKQFVKKHHSAFGRFGFSDARERGAVGAVGLFSQDVYSRVEALKNAAAEETA